MARPSRTDLLKHYRSSLDHAIRYREEEGYDSLWMRMVDMYRGKQLPANMTPEDRIIVNVAFSTVNVIYPSVSVNYPKITVQPNKPEDEDRAVFTEAVVNYQWKHHDLQPQFRLAVKDYLTVGHGWLKTGWTFLEVPQALGEPEMQEAYDTARAEADEYAAQRPELAAQLPTDEEIYSQLPTTRMVVSKDQPYVERISPHDVYVDSEATTLQDASWICQRIVRPYADVKKDPKYKASVRSRLTPDAGVGRSDAMNQREWKKRHARDPEDQRITVWEWWDNRSHTFSVFAEGGDEFLIDPQPMPFSFGHPFVMLRNYDVPDYFYPMGDLEALESLQLELNKTRSQLMQARKKFARKFLIRARAFGSSGRKALASDNDNELVEVLDDQTPFADLLTPVPQVPVPPELYQGAEQSIEDVRMVSGVSEYQSGQTPETRRTATEAAIITDSVNARASDKLAQIELGIGAAARRVVQLNAQFIDQQQWARVTGPEGAYLWVPYDRTDVACEYDFEVEAGSTQPKNETVRRQEATAMAEAMTPFVQLGVVDPMALARHLLQYGFGVKNPSKFIMQPQPMIDPETGMPVEGGGVGGPQGAPMGGGFQDEQGEIGNELPEGQMQVA